MKPTLKEDGGIAITSLEIAERTGKRHDHVMRDIKAMLKGLELDAPKFGGYYKASNGKQNPMFILPKREALILASGYDVKLRASIIDRLQELENNAKPKLNTTNTILNALVETQLKLDAQDEQLRVVETIAASSVKRLDAIETAVDYFTVVGYANLTGVNVSLERAQELGKKASQHCTLENIETGSTPDPRFGRINTYPKEVLELIFL